MGREERVQVDNTKETRKKVIPMSENNDAFGAEEILTEEFPEVSSSLCAENGGLVYFPPFGEYSAEDVFLYGVFLRAQNDERFVEELIEYSLDTVAEKTVN